MSDPRADVVSRQYEKWTYPFPVEDLDHWKTVDWDRMDPSHAHRLLWPDRPYRPDLEILVAGCGTNQAAQIAYMNPQATVVGVDVSEASLDHQRYLMDRHKLANLHVQRLPIEELPSLGRDFDLILSTGVLHHMADPLVGLRALADCLRPDGVIGLMLYAHWGRTGVKALQSAFHDMGLQQDDDGLAVAKDALDWLPANHLVRNYLNIAHDLVFDAGVVDTFLHGRDRDYRVEDCLEFVESAGLVFQQWLVNAPYYHHEILDRPRPLYDALNRLPERVLWSVNDRLRTTNGCHYFLACKPERPVQSYRIDFTTLDCLAYVPQLRHGCGVADHVIYRPDYRMTLDDNQFAVAQQIDGRRTIREISAAARAVPTGPQGNAPTVEKYTRKLFESLWRLDFLAMAIPAGA